MGGIKRGVLGFMIFLCILVTGQAFGAESKGQVLLILRPVGTGPEGASVVDYMIIKELGVMKTTLEDAGFAVVVATVDGQLVHGKTISVMPDLKFSDVKVADYKGVLVPCMNAGAIPPESIQILKDALAQGKPIAAQNGGVVVLSLAGGLKGKNFAISDYFVTGDGKQYFNPNGGTRNGDGVVQDGNILTSGICPTMAKYVKTPDGTRELTQKLIALIQ
jgi:putative intracellular protease/amidase